MTTLALVALCGILGLAVDLGWSHFIGRAAQAAADAAALAAAERALSESGSAGSFTCGDNVACAADPAPCPAFGNLASACVYAELNGFRQGGKQGRQQVSVQASDASVPPTVAPGVPPTAPGVRAHYWVTVRVAETVPQLFSAVMGHTYALVSARATAAVVDRISMISIVLLNRDHDVSALGAGVNVEMGGTPTIQAPNGIALASSLAGPGNYAANYAGGGSVQTPFTHIRGSGALDPSAWGNWQNWYDNRSDGGIFQDPLRDKGQPPITTRNLPPVAVPGGVLSTAVPACASGVCPEGVYFATGPPAGCSTCPHVATGAPLTVNSDLSFAAAAGGFGEFIFFGGMQVGMAAMDLGPGRYIFAGVASEGTPVFDAGNKALITGGNGEDAGRLLILTDSTYPGLQQHIAAIPMSRTWDSLTFGPASFKAGSNADSGVTLYGLDKSRGLPADRNAQGYGIEAFAPTVIWQDQRNSNVGYTADGNIDTSCPGATLDRPCANPGGDRGLELWANERSRFFGLIYQPRGAWMVLQAGPGYRGPLQIVSGALQTRGSGRLEMETPVVPLTRRAAALVE
jgi:hypothetical protein